MRVRAKVRVSTCRAAVRTRVRAKVRVSTCRAAVRVRVRAKVRVSTCRAAVEHVEVQLRDLRRHEGGPAG